MPRTFFDRPAPRDRELLPRAERPPILILGASTRAAAHSAVRAGFAPVCGDLFADLDLRACARVLEVADYPRDLAAAAAAVPDIPWIYTGGLENHPALVRKISRSRPLWGNGAHVLAKIRDPWRVASELAAAGLPALRVWPRTERRPDADGTWMRKPLRGAAGRGISVWDRHGSRGQVVRDAFYFQERRAGVPISALFLAIPERTLLLGVTGQLVGLAAVHAPSFAWCGTIAPATVSRETRASIVRIAERLAPWAGLRGLFGCDFLLDENGPWLTEVNPRYPASTEMVEYQLGVPLLDWHRRACELFASSPFVAPPLVVPPAGGLAPEPIPASHPNPPEVLGKIILYAKSELTAPDLSRFIIRPSNWILDRRTLNESLPYIADIPVPGTHITAGQPICTLFARARSEGECLAKLARRATRLEAHLR